MFKVLVVEDSEGDILLIDEAFSELSNNVDLKFIRDGELAINHLKNLCSQGLSIPDLILLDVNLPKISGHEILIKLKCNNLTKNVPVVMFSTSSRLKDIQTAYENNANSFLTKPNDLDDFFGIIEGIYNFWLLPKTT